MINDQFRQAMERGDVTELRDIWAHAMPHLPQPSDEQAEIAMHMSRTEAKFITLRARAYSHRWLEERGHRSLLPDELKPKAERLYPIMKGFVGISVNTRSEVFKPAAKLIHRAMSDAVEDAYAEGREDPVFVKARMAEARAKEVRKLFG